MSQLVTSDTQPYKLHDKDTGSSDVQVVRLTDRIQHLTQHLSVYAKDHSSRRTLLKMVVRRRKLLDYLRSESEERYQRVIKGLGLRK